MNAAWFQAQLQSINPNLIPLVNQIDTAGQLLTALQKTYTPAQAAVGDGLMAWDYSGCALQASNRMWEALAIHWARYQHLLAGQQGSTRIHKGTPLVRISDCFAALGFSVHAKRYLMLTLCEDAIKGEGSVSPHTDGVHFRLLSRGVTDEAMQLYAKQVFAKATAMPDEKLFPEALLQRLDDDWLTEFPSANEALFYRVNPKYAEYLLSKFGDRSGKALELLAQYLMSCMAGCRASSASQSFSTDYDVVCAMEGLDFDFRSGLGRHFVCECKDWKKPANFTVVAKFCRVLDSTKSRFGILFSKKGITGKGSTKDAEREQLKLFQDRGIVIVVLTLEDLERVAQGANLIALLRKQYETIRLDLRTKSEPKKRKPKKRKHSVT